MQTPSEGKDTTLQSMIILSSGFGVYLFGW